MNEGNQKILIVEDEDDIRNLMVFHLGQQSFSIDEAVDGRMAYDKLLKNKYDLVIMDWMIPEISGIDLISWMKKPDHIQHNTPVLMVTAKSDPSNIVLGLETGADDYLVKPFEFSVLKARLHNLLKRNQFLTVKTDAKKNDKKLVFGELVLDLESHKVFLKGEPLNLTYSEFRLLEALISNQGKVLSRKKIISYIQGEKILVTGRTIDTHISILRKKIKSYGDKIHTVRGVGYRVSYD